MEEDVFNLFLRFVSAESHRVCLYGHLRTWYWDRTAEKLTRRDVYLSFFLDVFVCVKLTGKKNKKCCGVKVGRVLKITERLESAVRCKVDLTIPDINRRVQ